MTDHKAEAERLLKRLDVPSPGYDNTSYGQDQIARKASLHIALAGLEVPGPDPESEMVVRQVDVLKAIQATSSTLSDGRPASLRWVASFLDNLGVRVVKASEEVGNG